MSKLNNVAITGGGTGGHFYPALAVAQEIRRRNPDATIQFIGTATGIEATGSPAAGFTIRHIQAAGFGAHPAKLVKFGSLNTLGMFQAFSILQKQKPQLVVGSGGFVSFPVLMAAKVLNIPYVILEQNVVPGKVNKLMSRWAARIMASFDPDKQHFPMARTQVTGNPIRRDILERTREEALQKLDLQPGKFTLLITGASQGARSVNNAIIKSLPQWQDKDWQILHLTGPKNLDEVKAATEPLVKEFRGMYRPIGFSEDMASMYAAADLVIARSGASNLAEITACGLPSILVPYPHHADQQQVKNARWVEERGGGITLLDQEVEEKLAGLVLELVADEPRRKDMSEKAKALGKPNAQRDIVDEIEKLVK